jgi:methionyl-tRNA formyltransferase
LVLERLHALVPDANLIIFSFPEDPHEPPYLDDIRALAASIGAEFHEARQIGAARWRDYWERTAVDLLLTVNWRYMIPAAVYQRARLGAFVFHDSALPVYRGFSPTVWAMINGEAETGATLLEMAEAYDTGRIVGQRIIAMGPDATIAEVMEDVTSAYLDLLAAHLPDLLAGTAPLTAQDEGQTSYACKLLPDDLVIDWAWSSQRIYNLIRATTRPYPGAFTTLAGDRLTVWRAERLPGYPRFVGRVPGRVVEIREEVGSVVLTGDGALLLTEVERAGAGPARADTVLNRISHTLGR